MKSGIITELVEFKVLRTTTDEQLLDRADILNRFLQKQDGFIDAELVKAVEGNKWYFIYHIENYEKLKATAENIHTLKLIDAITELIESDSMCVSVYQQYKKW